MATIKAVDIARSITYTEHDQDSRIKRALVLAGGGMRVAYQVGVLLALEEARITFDHIDGTSGGIFNTAMLASGLKPREMAERWRTLKLGNFISGKEAKSYLKPFKMHGFADADNIRKKVFPHLGIDLASIHQNNRFDVTFNVCNFSTKSVEAIPNHKVTEDHLIAGVSLPIFMPAIQIGETWYTDAVWIKDANLIEAVRQGAQELWLVWAIGNSPTYLSGAFHQYVHMIEMSANGALLEEYSQINLGNSLKKKVGTTVSDKPPVKLFVFKSSVPLPLDPDFFFNKINARELINMGYAQAKDYLKTLPESGESLDYRATQNDEPQFIFSLRGVFSGLVDQGSSTSLITYSLFFRFCTFPDKDSLEVYSSVIFSRPKREIPTYDHQVNNIRCPEGNRMTLHAKIMMDDKIHRIEISTVLTNPWELLLGLSFKKISFQIWDENDTLIVDAILYQSLMNRLKAVYYSSLKTVLTEKMSIKKRVAIIKKFIAHGV
ncbi:patatin-like phospholipase family protein [Nitrosomonas nitrosa]|uniref:patatin-like phospholipase family protein n=1 Tax=Nitrosomonas nitrosa TaxID=52442 RepID=UPI0023F773CC|nr:patatin-like phospholipase family protein [Nitrosomonas nitrosa]MCO6434453.1 patatin-like phospholipase family protein [Nitrosomonas nitrosa]